MVSDEKEKETTIIDLVVSTTKNPTILIGYNWVQTFVIDWIWRTAHITSKMGVNSFRIISEAIRNGANVDTKQRTQFGSNELIDAMLPVPKNDTSTYKICMIEIFIRNALMTKTCIIFVDILDNKHLHICRLVWSPLALWNAQSHCVHFVADCKIGSKIVIRCLYNNVFNGHGM